MSGLVNPALCGLISGRIAYRAADGEEVGRETFDIARHAGGQTMRALCQMDDIGLVRDVTMAFDREWRPLDAFCRITVEGRRMATTWFETGPTAFTFEGVTAASGRISRSFALENGPLRYLGLHPLQNDALVAAVRGESDPREFRPIEGVTNSISPNGDQGLEPSTICIEVAWIGREEIEVTAGRFQAGRYAIRWTPEWPAADLWVRPEDHVFLKLTWEMMPSWYELTHLCERTQFE